MSLYYSFLYNCYYWIQFWHSVSFQIKNLEFW